MVDDSIQDAEQFEELTSGNEITENGIVMWETVVFSGSFREAGW